MERKVIIRRKEVLNHLPKEIRAGAKVKIGSMFVDRLPLKGVDGEEEAKLLPLLKRLGMAVTDVDDPQVFDEAYEASSLIEKLAQRNGRWALVSKSDPKKVLQYYRGPKGERPSQDWVKDVERRVHSFEDAAGVGTITKQNQTVDVGPNEVKKQAAKWGNKVDKNGRPPLLRK